MMIKSNLCFLETQAAGIGLLLCLYWAKLYFFILSDPHTNFSAFYIFIKS